MFLEGKINILERFLKDHVTRKNWSNEYWKFSFSITGIQYILKYIKIDDIAFFIVKIFHNIAVFIVYLI